MRRYARTVKSGERPLMVWTRETGILVVAVADSRCPPIWKKANGRVVLITSLDGYRIPCRKACMFLGRAGNIVASHENSMQKKATNANWISVRVAGFGKALRMDFDEVFVRALEVYHIIQRVYGKYQHLHLNVWRSYKLLTWARPAPSKHLQFHAHSH